MSARRRALTVRQPWATLLVAGLKRMETRTRDMHLNDEPVVIHAGKAMPCRRGQTIEVGPYTVERDLSGLLLRGPGLAWPYRLPMSALVGEVTFFQTRRTESLEHKPTDVERSLGDHSPGRWAWSTSSPGRYARPLTWERGQLGLWTLPADVVLPEVTR